MRLACTEPLGHTIRRLEARLGFSDLGIELSADAALTDIVTERYDAGVRLGEQVAKDMVAVRLGPERTLRGFHLYYPSRRQLSPAFALLVEPLRYRGAR